MKRIFFLIMMGVMLCGMIVPCQTLYGQAENPNRAGKRLVGKTAAPIVVARTGEGICQSWISNVSRAM